MGYNQQGVSHVLTMHVTNKAVSFTQVLGGPIALSYMSPDAGGGAEFRGLSQ